MSKQRKALGRGLSALIPKDLTAGTGRVYREVDVDLLRANPDQPRQKVAEADLQDLANSIKENGLLQPIVVRSSGEGFEIIAGERRWRAASLAGLHKVPVIVREASEQERLKLALVENIQRKQLNPMEEAAAYRLLMDQHDLTQEEVSDRVGKDRSTVSNIIRLLDLPDSVASSVASGEITAGHARSLLALEDEGRQTALCREILRDGLSVRQVEERVRRLRKARNAKPRRGSEKDPNVLAAEESLKRALGTPVRIFQRGGSGRIEIRFSSKEELHRLYEHLTVPERS